MKGFNDSDRDFEELLLFLKDDDRIKISFYNTIENGKYNKSSEERFQKLHDMLNERGIYNVKFDSVGDSIDVGCDQMAAKKLERVKKYV